MAYGFSAVNKNLNNGIIPNGNLSNNNILTAVRVKNIILNETSTNFKELGEWDALGAIEFEDVFNPSVKGNAKPLFGNIKNFPLINEIVYLFSLPSTLIGETTSENIKYYLTPVALWNHPHHNGYPTNANENPSTQQKTYIQTELGNTSKITNQPSTINLGQTFIERSNIHPLLPFEGDIIYEGRWGNSVRIGSTVKDTINNWSITGSNGDPILIIRNGQYNNSEPAWKPTTENINLDSGEFDIVVRDFNDADDNMVVLEKYSRCSMNPEMPGFVGRKIGTADGEYELRSKYIMLSLADNHPSDAFPAGFKGFVNNTNFSGTTLGSVIYKTEYIDAGDVVTYNADGTENIESGDKVKKVMLGLSSQVGFDKDLFKYKGIDGDTETFGFHLSLNAANITGTTYQCTPYDLEGTTKGALENIAYRKFTFATGGGTDGWDIYRTSRTNTDSYIFGKTTYSNNKTTGAYSGVFNDDTGNSDYYAYLDAINTFSNPEAIDINVFATPGINFRDHSSLVNQAIDMIENDRADSLYIMNSPNITGTTGAADVVEELDIASIDSNYSATYWPWIQVRDTDNATQIYIPPTGEVLKNIALTDNVSYPWFAVAGYSRGLVNAIKATKKLTLDERDELYKNRINPIATFSDTGTIIWGNKTLQVKESALDRINVRRLLLRARKLISAVAIRLLFEQNDEQVRQEFLRLVNPILDSIKKERGLYEFKVTVSSDPEDIDANTLRGKIYIKPTRSLEFIDVEFVITPTGASFENI